MTLSDNSKLRVGLLMDSLTLPAWAYEMLVTVQHSAYAEVKLIVLNDSEEPKRRSLFARVVRNWGIILYLAYCKLEDRVFAPVPNAFEPRNAAELLRDVPVIRAKPRRSKHSDRLEDDDIEKISQYHIDVFVRLEIRRLVLSSWRQYREPRRTRRVLGGSRRPPGHRVDTPDPDRGPG